MTDPRMDRSDFIKRGSLVTATLASGLLGTAPPARGAEVQTFKLAFPDNAHTPSTKVAQRFASEVATKTNGRFKVDIFPGGTLGSETNIVAGLQTGTIDFAMHTAGFVESYVPTVGVLDMPFIFKDAAQATRVLAGPVGKQLAADCSARNIVLLGWSQNAWRNVECVDRAIKTPGDLKDVKIRIQAGPVFAAIFEAVGAVPVVMDWPDVYVGLSQKTIDALEVPVPSFVSAKLYEVSKHISLTRHVYNATLFMASKPKLAAMSPADQEVIRRAGAGASAYWLNLMGQADKDAAAFAKHQGVQIIEVDREAFRKAMAPVYDKFKAKFGDLLPKILAETGG
ncbi:MAG: TRAP transporter substrate-binding protein [bacterium]|nr:TRAP transporter substrate-binding protein [bacterium]